MLTSTQLYSLHIIKPTLSASRGFTLIEVVLVTLLLGIISIFVVGRLSLNTYSLEYEARRVFNDIRYTQLLSVTTGQRYTWQRISSSSYQILNPNGTAIVLANGATQMTLSTGVSIGTMNNLPNNLVTFDSLGVPYAIRSLSASPISANASISVLGGGLTRVITITAQTGFGSLQ